MNRRGFFGTLAAVALLPLAKLRPRKEVFFKGVPIIRVPKLDAPETNPIYSTPRAAASRDGQHYADAIQS